ncbi:MAG: substrate-binding domain-containing protein [Deltaproteobacteria bacterium]|nr:substrate-binding domain-containing protein [Deltaproteobacteria bacterium]
MKVAKMLGFSVAWIVPLILGATVFPGNAHAETLRISGTGGAIGGMRLLAEAFRKAEPGVDVVIPQSIGSSGGIRAVIAGKLDIGVSARPLSPEELAQGARETAYARTALVFAVHPDVKRSDITLAEVREIYAGRKTTWDDGTALRLILRPAFDTDTTTLRMISPEMAGAVDQSQKREGLIVATTDQNSADAIERTRGSFGTTVLPLVVAGKKRIRTLSLSGVKPTTKSVRDGTYPSTKTFNMVTRPARSPAAAKFIRFVRSPEGKAILSRVGHVPLP